MAYDRLNPQQRREQLLDTGAAMFAEKPYDEVLIKDVAARAGVSRALMYHHFLSKRDFYVAILKRANDRFSRCVSPDPGLTLAQQLARSLEAQIQSFVDHPFGAVAINRHALAYDPATKDFISEELNLVCQLLIDQLVAEGHLRDAAEIAVDGWFAFIRAACAKWIQSQSISQADLAKVCLHAFDCTLGTRRATCGDGYSEYAICGEYFAVLTAGVGDDLAW